MDKITNKLKCETLYIRYCKAIIGVHNTPLISVLFELVYYEILFYKQGTKKMNNKMAN